MNDEHIQPTLEEHVSDTVSAALAEDVGAGDLTAGLVPNNQRATACVITRENCVICGQPWLDEVFRQLDPTVTVTWHVSEGQTIAENENLCEINGLARPLLTGERTALNFLQLLSATATQARSYVDAVADTKATILDTRKTLPGLRLAQKYAVQTGGAQNHRIGLYDAILIKENHIAAAGSIQAAVDHATEQSQNVMIEVEVETLEQLAEGLRSGAQRLLLDNFTLEDMQRAVATRDKLKSTVTLEASGGVSLETVREIAATGVDYISIGALTKDIQAIDLSMRFNSEPLR